MVGDPHRLLLEGRTVFTGDLLMERRALLCAGQSCLLASVERSTYFYEETSMSYLCRSDGV